MAAATYRPSEALGPRVRKARGAHAWTQTELAERMTACGYRSPTGGPITQRMVSRIEAGKVSASVDELFALSVVLNVEPAALVAPPGPVSLATLDGEVHEVSDYLVWSWWRGEVENLIHPPHSASGVRWDHRHALDKWADATFAMVTRVRSRLAEFIFMAFSSLGDRDLYDAAADALADLELAAANAAAVLDRGAAASARDVVQLRNRFLTVQHSLADFHADQEGTE